MFVFFSLALSIVERGLLFEGARQKKLASQKKQQQKQPPSSVLQEVESTSLERTMEDHNQGSGVEDKQDAQSNQLQTEEFNELQVENQLLEQYLKQKNVLELPQNWSEENIPIQEYDCSASTPIDFKLQIAIETLSQLNNTLETRKEAANAYISTLKVMLNETELRIGDIQRDAHDFQRDVVEGGKCKNNPERYRAEKFVRYMEGKLYDQESALDKLRLKNNTLINRKRKLEAQLSREEVKQSCIPLNSICFQ